MTMNISDLKLGKMRAALAYYQGLARDYASLLSGSLGRLVFSLGYFIVLANTLSVADFGIFAAAVAVGVTLSRMIAFGFMSPLYRISTVKPQLTGTYIAGFLALGLASLPFFAGIAYIIWFSFFKAEISLHLFAIIVISEAIIWRFAEIIIIINNGFKRFGRAAGFVIFGTFSRMMAAFAFAYFAAEPNVESWALYFLSANIISLLVIAVLGLPRQRYRFVPKLYPRRLKDALSVTAAELVFYAQMELDKVLVLALAGAQTAGVYAIVMRLVDLTAMPMRSAMTLLVQKLMQMPDFMKPLKNKLIGEGVIYVVSTLALLGLALLMMIKPDLLGDNVAKAAPLLLLATLIPGPRNLTEYHGELLYARGQTFLRAINLAILAIIKIGLMVLLIDSNTPHIVIMAEMVAIFIGLYIISALLTYPRLNAPAIRI